MIDEYLFSKIAFDMKQLGIEEYSLDPIYFKDSAAATKYIESGNAYYYLNTNPNFTALYVLTEDNILNIVAAASPSAATLPTPADFVTMQSYQYQSFKGRIFVQQAPFINIEFMAVTPMPKRATEVKPTVKQAILNLLAKIEQILTKLTH